MKVDAFIKRPTGAFGLIERTTEAFIKVQISRKVPFPTSYDIL